jgi:hypothetical protein
MLTASHIKYMHRDFDFKRFYRTASIPLAAYARAQARELGQTGRPFDVEAVR